MEKESDFEFWIYLCEKITPFLKQVEDRHLQKIGFCLDGIGLSLKLV